MPRKPAWQYGIIRKKKRKNKDESKKAAVPEPTVDQPSTDEILQKTLQNLYQKLISVKDEGVKARLLENVKKLAGDDQSSSTEPEASTSSVFEELTNSGKSTPNPAAASTLLFETLPEAGNFSNQPSTSSFLSLSSSTNQNTKRARESDGSEISVEKKKKLDGEEVEPIERRVTRKDYLRNKFGLKDFKIYTKKLFKADIRAINEKLKADSLLQRQKKNSAVADEFLSDFTITSKRCDLTGKVVFSLTPKPATSDNKDQIVDTQSPPNLDSKSEKSEEMETGEDTTAMSNEKLDETVGAGIKPNSDEIEVIEMGEDENDDLFVLLNDSPAESDAEPPQLSNQPTTANSNLIETEPLKLNIPKTTYPVRRKSFHQVFEDRIAQIQKEELKRKQKKNVKPFSSTPARDFMQSQTAVLPNNTTQNSLKLAKINQPVDKDPVKTAPIMPKNYASSHKDYSLKYPRYRSVTQTHTIPSPPTSSQSTQSLLELPQSGDTQHLPSKSTEQIKKVPRIKIVPFVNEKSTIRNYNKTVVEIMRPTVEKNPKVIEKTTMKICVYHTDVDIDKTIVAPHKSNSTVNSIGKLNLRPWIPNSDKHLKNQEHGDAMLEQVCLFADFKCMIPDCSFFTTNSNIFRKHLMIHYANTKNIQITCAYCQQMFTLIDDLIAHITRVHSFNKYQCPYCFYRSCVDSNVIFHIKKYHPSFPKVILETNLKPRSEEAEYEFMLESRQKFVPPIVCVFCRSSYYLFESFQVHLNSHGPNLTSKCTRCFNRISKNGFLYHLKNCFKYGIYQCIYCKFGTDDISTIRMHLADNHASRLAFICQRQLCTHESEVKVGIEQTRLVKLFTRLNQTSLIKCQFSSENLLNKGNLRMITHANTNRQTSTAVSTIVSQTTNPSQSHQSTFTAASSNLNQIISSNEKTSTVKRPTFRIVSKPPGTSESTQKKVFMTANTISTATKPSETTNKVVPTLKIPIQMALKIQPFSAVQPIQKPRNPQSAEADRNLIQSLISNGNKVHSMQQYQKVAKMQSIEKSNQTTGMSVVSKSEFAQQSQPPVVFTNKIQPAQSSQASLVFTNRTQPIHQSQSSVVAVSRTVQQNQPSLVFTNRVQPSQSCIVFTNRAQPVQQSQSSVVAVSRSQPVQQSQSSLVFTNRIQPVQQTSNQTIHNKVPLGQQNQPYSMMSNRIQMVRPTSSTIVTANQPVLLNSPYIVRPGRKPQVVQSNMARFTMPNGLQQNSSSVTSNSNANQTPKLKLVNIHKLLEPNQPTLVNTGNRTIQQPARSFTVTLPSSNQQLAQSTAMRNTHQMITSNAVSNARPTTSTTSYQTTVPQISDVFSLANLPFSHL